VNIAIVLVNFNGLSDTIECLESIAQIDDGQLQTIVVDNASTSNDAEFIAEKFDWVTTIASPENTGWSGGNNLGIRQALTPHVQPVGVRRWMPTAQPIQPADVVFLLNNDTVVDASITQKLRFAVKAGYDIVGPVINEYSEREVVQTEGIRFNPRESTEFFERIFVDLAQPESITPVDIVNGCAVAITRAVFEAIGLVDERFFLIGEESDFCLRAQAAGFRLGVLHQSLVFHKHSVSFQRAGKPLQRYYGIRNLWVLVNRHSGVNGRRGHWASRLAYFRHAYHLYCHEREMDNQMGASAVAIGVADALRSRFGAQPIQSGWLAWILNCLAGFAWKCRGGTVRESNTRPSVSAMP
jgi:GT2 family glycosyltransferase